MILDAHVHVGRYGEVWSPKFAAAMLGQFGKFPKWWGDRQPWQAHEFDVDVEHLVGTMDRLGISRAVIWGLACKPFECRTDPAVITAAIDAHPTRFLGFHVADPVGYPDDGPELLEHVVRDLGFRGVKVFPGYNNAYPNDARLFPLYAMAERLEVVVAVHTGYTVTHTGADAYAPLLAQYPLHLEQVAASFPRLRLIMTHFANPWAREAVQLMRKYDNVYADTAYGAFPLSWKVDALVWAKNFGVLHKVLFGSDYPLHSPEESLELHRAMPAYTADRLIEPRLTEEDMAGVLGGNAARLFELSS